MILRFSNVCTIPAVGVSLGSTGTNGLLNVESLVRK